MLEIPQKERIEAEIDLPGSKSITNRALIIGALAKGETYLLNWLECEDTGVMIDCLRTLGFNVSLVARDLKIRGQGGEIPAKDGCLDTADSGTTMRFLTGLLALSKGSYLLDGNQRMRERPIEPLLKAIRLLGVEAASQRGNNCPPVKIRSRGLKGGTCELDAEISSQFLSSLLLSAPYAAKNVRIRLKGTPVSRPYVTMTLQMMRAFGVTVDEEGPRVFHIPAGQAYRGGVYRVEGDASSASYFWTAAALTDGSMKVANIGENSIQGDARFVDILQAMGARVRKEPGCLEVSGSIKKSVEVDLNDMPDMVPTLAVAALFAAGRTVIKNVPNLRYKESDRLRATATELRKIGGKAEELSNGLIVEGGELHGAEIETYNDHRIAMAFALAGLKVPGIKIKNPECVGKTFPGFFDLLFSL